MKNTWIMLLLCFLGLEAMAQKIDLSGEWHFAIDRADKGIKEKWFSKILKEDLVILNERFIKT